MEDTLSTGNTYGLVLQGTPQPQVLEGNTIEGNTTEDIVSEGDLPVPDQPLPVPDTPDPTSSRGRRDSRYQAEAYSAVARCPRATLLCSEREPVRRAVPGGRVESCGSV